MVLTGALGDVARALPLASLLKLHRPGTRVSWLVDWRWQQLVAAHRAVDRLIVFPRERTPAALVGLVRQLRAESFDVTLDLQRHLKSGVCSRLSGAPRRIGFHRANTKEFNDLFNTEHIGHRPASFSKLRHYLDFAEHLGLPVPDALDFGIDGLADARMLPPAVRDAGAGFAAVVMGSSWPSKDWSVEGYSGLLARIGRETSCAAVLVGDESQRSVADRVVADVPGARVVNLVGQTTVAELGSTLAAARAAVGPDSGPGHLAAAVGTPYVSLFGPTDVGRVAPYRCDHLAVRSPVECGCPGRRHCRRRAGRCMDAITPEMVWRVLRPLL
jgi:ADP-heptose:LPS heptosyltransferase